MFGRRPKREEAPTNLPGRASTPQAWQPQVMDSHARRVGARSDMSNAPVYDNREASREIGKFENDPRYRVERDSKTGNVDVYFNGDGKTPADPQPVAMFTPNFNQNIHEIYRDWKADGQPDSELSTFTARSPKDNISRTKQAGGGAVGWKFKVYGSHAKRVAKKLGSPIHQSCIRTAAECSLTAVLGPYHNAPGFTVSYTKKAIKVYEDGKLGSIIDIHPITNPKELKRLLEKYRR